MHMSDILLELLIIVISVVSLFSNLLVLLCFIYSADIRGQVPGIFILNLSFCNIIIAIMNMPATLAGIKVLKVARFHCKRIDVITVQTLLLLVDIHPSVKQRCLLEQKKRRQRATKKICIFIGTFVVCFAPYVITRLTELAPDIHIDRHWGIVSKCLAYSKGALDPFVYSLLRQQFKKALISMANRALGRGVYPSSGHSSTADTDNDGFSRRVS
ncbi:hypothetical protein AALO_G00012810 [Alosa alosa]|uniref:G-protein coupled receptors family 1 profile domain-containing protein n=1 Tax=Alosa alosa TaxID=278164 RepID=A0AAV6HJ15_9TELE|nr:hypothetical protein AALO_G00012810 [Alosa alosa]